MNEVKMKMGRIKVRFSDYLVKYGESENEDETDDRTFR